MAVTRAKGSGTYMTYEYSRCPGDGKGKGAGAGNRNEYGISNANANANGYWQQTISKQTRDNSSPESVTCSRQKHHRFKSEPTFITSSLLCKDGDKSPETVCSPIRRVSAIKQSHFKSWPERGSRSWPTTPLNHDSDTLDQSYKMPPKRPPDDAAPTRVIQCIDPPSRIACERSILNQSENASKRLEQNPKASEMERAASMSNLEAARQHEAYPSVLETGASITNDGFWLTSDERDWQRMRQLRLENWAFRSRAHEMRMALRKKQIAKSTVEDRLFQLFRRKELGLDSDANENGEGGHTISQLMAQNQEIRDEYGPLEDLCLEMEDELTEKESELTKLEQRFDKQWERKPKQKATDDRDVLAQDISPQDVSSSSGCSSDDEEEDSHDHPLVTQFLLKKGELNILRERIDELLDEKMRLEDIKDSLRLVGRFLVPEDQAWLDKFPASEAKLQQDIKVLSDQVDFMRRDCFDRKLINDQDQAIDFQGQEKIAFMDEGLDVQDKVSEYVKYPYLLPKPGYKTKPVHGKLDAESDRTMGDINYWLLDMLRTSPLEVSLLARTFEGRAGKMIDAWETSVLSFWYNDGTNAGKIEVYTASMTTDALLGSQRSESSRNSFGIFIRSSMKILPGSDSSDTAEYGIYVHEDDHNKLSL